MTDPEKETKKPCLCCGNLTSGFITEEWGTWKDTYKKEQFFVQNPDRPLTDLDRVGYPICEKCFKSEFQE